MIGSISRPSHLGRKFYEARRIAKLWYPRPVPSKCIRDNPELQERVYQLLVYGYSIADLRDWFRLDRINLRTRLNSTKALRIWEDIKAFYGFRCAYCGAHETSLQKDHVVALSKGGSDTMGNIVPACSACNLAKGAISLSDWPKFHALQLHLLIAEF